MFFDWLLIASLSLVVVVLARHVPSVLAKMHTTPSAEDALQYKEMVENLAKTSVAVGKVAHAMGEGIATSGKTIAALGQKTGALSLWKRIKFLRVKRGKDTPQEKEEEISVARADSLFEARRLREAEAMYLKLCAKDPHNAHLYAQLGIVYLETKNFKDARDAFTAAIKQDPTVASRHVNLGIALLELGHAKAAKEAFDKAITLKPGNKKYEQLAELAKARS
jgi:tetratricopeptide (TPR) repeat protein